MVEKKDNRLKIASFTAESLYRRFDKVFTRELLTKAGISTDVFSDPNTEVPLGDHCRLMELAAKELEDDSIGLKIGSAIDAEHIGALGYAIFNSPTVRTALVNLARYLHVYARGCDMSLRIDGDNAVFIFSYSIAEPDIFGRRQEAECTLAMVKRLIELSIGSPFRLKEVWFEHPKPKNTNPHKETFGLVPKFSGRHNSFIFDIKQLDIKTVQSEARLYEVLEGYLDAELAQQEEYNDVVASVGKIIAQSLSNGVPNIEQVASQLYMTKRTLQRRLGDHGKLFNEYADDIRQSMAKQYVRKTELPLTEVAFLLGYAHVSAFSRAFRRWTGMTPKDFRINQAE